MAESETSEGKRKTSHVGNKIDKVKEIAKKLKNLQGEAEKTDVAETTEETVEDSVSKSTGEETDSKGASDTDLEAASAAKALEKKKSKLGSEMSTSSITKKSKKGHKNVDTKIFDDSDDDEKSSIRNRMRHFKGGRSNVDFYDIFRVFDRDGDGIVDDIDFEDARWTKRPRAGGRDDFWDIFDGESSASDVFKTGRYRGLTDEEWSHREEQ